MSTGGNRKSVGTSAPGPWMKWRTRKRADRCIRFIEAYCRVTKGHGSGELIRLRRFQKAWIRRALADGTSSAILSIARGNGKSTLLAALAVWALYDPDPESGTPQVPVVATTVAQAMRSVYTPAVAMIEADPELASRAMIYTAIGMTKVAVPATGGELFPLADRQDSLQGLDPSFAIVDELGFTSVSTWQSLLLASGKRPRSTIVGIGTHGVSTDNALAWLHVLWEADELPDGCDYTYFGAPAGCAIDDPAAWKAANPALSEGLLNEESMRTAVAMSTEAEVRIFRLNQFGIDGYDGWLGDDGRALWGSLADPELELELGAPTWVGVDVGLKRDSTAVVAVQRRPDGRLHAWARIWTPTPEREVDVTHVMQWLRDLTALGRVLEVPYDPRLFDLPAKMLRDEGLPMVEFPQAPERMTPAVGSTFELIARGELTHDGGKTFASQVLNASPRYNAVGFTLAKGPDRGRIDAAVALCIAVDRALRSTARPRTPLIIG